MSYANAREIFPEDILEIIQKYVDGEYIYIPKKEENKMAWGQLTQSKEEIYERNLDIYNKYKEGIAVKILAEMYYLSPKSIQRIVLKVKREIEEETRH